MKKEPPLTIGEIKNDAMLWTPEQMALRFAADCQTKKINPVRAIILYEENDRICHYISGMGESEGRHMAQDFSVLSLIQINSG